MLIYQVIATSVCVAILLNTLNNLRVLRRPDIQAPPASGPLVSILIPARNEARAIARCVESLAQQDYPRCEILVLDDQSEDATATIVDQLAQHYPHVQLIRGQPLPPDWHGKAYACAQLAQAARGEWLLFVDADSVHAPACVSTALRQAAEQRADLLTMMPTMTVGSFGEALLVPTITLTFVTFLPLGLVTRHPSPLLAGAFGPFLLFRRDAYVRIGGHTAVRRDIVEDMQLSRLVKRHGGRVAWIDGTALMRVRLYHGHGEAWRGIGKSAFAAIDYSLPGLLLGLPACLVLFGGPYLLLMVGLVGHEISGVMTWLPLAQILLLVLSQLLLMQRFHMPRAMAVLYAGTILAVVLVTLHSAYQTVLGTGVAWKGRTYQFDPQRRGSRTRVSWATELARVRMLIALLLIVAGWRQEPPQVAVTLLLLGWTIALFEHSTRKGTESRLSLAADAAAALASLAYLQLSGLLPAQLVLPTLLVLAVSTRWWSWHVVAAMASV
ncbi:MAG TPA: glycosyltransferase, partial [Ktedonobacterales bacterium]